ncbi:hypothetical protein ACS0TY_021714 [Phlomoides rotata]
MSTGAITGSIKVSYEEQTLSIEVKMPHDASKYVCDTRGLSGLLLCLYNLIMRYGFAVGSQQQLLPLKKVFILLESARVLLSHSLAGLLQRINRIFDSAYKALMKAFTEHNKLGNLPYGFRANTWLVPSVVAENPSTFPPLPVEDEVGEEVEVDKEEMGSMTSAMPCKTPEERHLRDRKAFLLHSLFVDVSVFKAVAAIKHLIENNQQSADTSSSSILHEERVGDLLISITKDPPNGSVKLDSKNNGSKVLGISNEELTKRNFLKGITADGSATVHDTSTLGVMAVRHCGHTTIVKVSAELENTVAQVNHTPIVQPSSKSFKCQFRRITDHQAIGKRLQGDESTSKKSIRWELGACWMQHLQSQASGKDEPKKNEEVKVEPSVKGLGKHGGLLKDLKKKSDDQINKTDSNKELSANNNSDANKKELEKEEDKEILWTKSPDELIEMAHKYYAETALPKLVADFGSLELSSVDGRTLTDFMHTRGLRMCSLGRRVI